MENPDSSPATGFPEEKGQTAKVPGEKVDRYDQPRTLLEAVEKSTTGGLQAVQGWAENPTEAAMRPVGRTPPLIGTSQLNQ